MKNILYFFLLCAYVLGTIGGVAYLLYYHQYPIAVAVAVLAFMAFDKAREYFGKLNG